MRLDGDLGIERRNFSGGGDGFRQRLGSVGFVEQNLALQVAGLNVITVDDAKVSHAGARQQRSQGRAGSSATDDGDTGFRQSRLTRFADGRKEDLAGIPFRN